MTTAPETVWVAKKVKKRFRKIDFQKQGRRVCSEIKMGEIPALKKLFSKIIILQFTQGKNKDF